MSKHRNLKYNRILLKISGEILGQKLEVLNQKILTFITNQIVETYKLGVKIGVVIGGGNIIRGKTANWLNQIDADMCGMMATIINGIALQSALRPFVNEVYLRGGFEITGLLKRFNKQEDSMLYNNGGILILVGGTGNPLFTTDTAAAMRAVELSAQILIKGTKVRGIYSCDPEKYKDAKFFPKLKYQEAIDKGLNVMDMTAFRICQESKIPICVYDLTKYPLTRIIFGDNIGTLVS